VLKNKPEVRGHGKVFHRKLSEYESLYRLRAGDYRIFFEIQESDEVILVVKVGHRREVYRK